jgi:hypothetical protein
MCLPTACPHVAPVVLQAAWFVGPPLQYTVSAALGSVEHTEEVTLALWLCTKKERKKN